jgi:hypothetical protein
MSKVDIPFGWPSESLIVLIVVQTIISPSVEAGEQFGLYDRAARGSISKLQTLQDNRSWVQKLFGSRNRAHNELNGDEGTAGYSTHSFATPNAL